MGVIDLKCGSDHPSIDCQIASYWELEQNGTEEGLGFEPEHHVFTYNGSVLPSTTKILKDAGMTPDYSFTDTWYADRGSAVHLATALWDRGTLDMDTVDPQIVGFLNAYRQFRKDFPIDILGIEVMRRSPRYGYSGIVDRLVEGNRHYKLFLKSNGKYKLVEVKNIKTHLTYFLSALIVTTGHTGAGLDIATSNLGTWKKRFLKEG